MCAQWGDVSSTTELAAVRSNDGSAKAQTNCNVEGSVIHPEENSTSEILLLLARECVYVRVFKKSVFEIRDALLLPLTCSSSILDKDPFDFHAVQLLY